MGKHMLCLKKINNPVYGVHGQTYKKKQEERELMKETKKKSTGDG